MDLSEKRRQLEEIREARKAKERSVLQQRQNVVPPKRESITGSEGLVVGGSISGSTGCARTRCSVSVSKCPGDGDHAVDTKECKPACGNLSSASLSACSISRSVAEDGVGCSAARRQKTLTTSAPSVSAKTLCSASHSSVKSVENTGSDPAKGGCGVAKASVTSVDRDIVGSVFTSFGGSKSPCVGSAGAAFMTLEHSIFLGSVCGSGSRCVLDVRVLNCPSSEDGDACSKGLLFVAASLSEACNVENLSDMMMQGATGGSTFRGFDSVGLVLLICIQQGTDGGGPVVVPLCFSSEVRTLTYTKRCPHLLFGGAANGCIVAWRIDQALQQCGRAASPQVLTTFGKSSSLSYGCLPSSSALSASAPVYPCVQSFPSPHSHQTQVLAMAVHGDLGSHHLFSISEHGQVCMWEPSKLCLPSSTRESLVQGMAPGCVGSCAAFVSTTADAMNKVFFGCLNGHILEGGAKGPGVVDMQPISGSTVGVDKSTHENPSCRVRHPKEKCYDTPAHCAAVVAVAPHPFHGDPHVSATLLSAAADGSCYLWLGSRCAAIEGLTSQVNCLQWSPTHSAVFAAGESSGRVAIWDLGRSNFPVASVYPQTGARLGSGGSFSSKPSTTTSARKSGTFVRNYAPISSLSFSEDGSRVVCGSSDGEVHVFHLQGDLVKEQRAQSRERATEGGGNSYASTAVDCVAEELPPASV
ncbi:WD domain [Trypanosoma brucei equiperdum]|uniref:WD domain n=1 Tax=Trypanosoma brucei equiperdum TaxID=630700 RepID=A0A3L6L7N8_9TRYP|nr:WD domain [Trypanosoma brucei equiperdum]